MKILPTLHILNGDASVPAFKVANLPGQLLVWREILASGPAVGTIPETEFWEMRTRFITDSFKVPASDYQQKVLEDLQKLETASAFFEVVLWFDTDLVCQVNLLYLLHKLYAQRPSVVSVCTPENKPIGYSTLDEMQWLFEHRRTIAPAELQQAATLWTLYAGPDPFALQSYLQQQHLFSDHLKLALDLHMQCFPGSKTGLGEDQKLLLNALSDQAIALPEVYKQFWKTDPGYGYGDGQLHLLLEALSPDLVQLTQDEASISETGQLVRAGKMKYENQRAFWLGGARVGQEQPKWQRDEETGQIEFSRTA